MKVWARVPTVFRVLPNFHSCFFFLANIFEVCMQAIFVCKQFTWIFVYTSTYNLSEQPLIMLLRTFLLHFVVVSYVPSLHLASRGKSLYQQLLLAKSLLNKTWWFQKHFSSILLVSIVVQCVFSQRKWLYRVNSTSDTSISSDLIWLTLHEVLGSPELLAWAALLLELPCLLDLLCLL